jgi:murein L,D-transpeptidase YcbB/YkuD
VKASVRLTFMVPPRASAEIAVGTENLAQTLAQGDAMSAPITAALERGQCRLDLADDLGARGLDLELGIGELHAPDATIGIQARLANLGHYYGPVDGVATSATQAGVARFQAREGLAITGIADAETIEALRRAHDGEDAP